MNQNDNNYFNRLASTDHADYDRSGKSFKTQNGSDWLSRRILSSNNLYTEVLRLCSKRIYHL
ncbi:hypothetical protein UFOVP449_232 [uncultured Caudovirales phage]|uniref:Uncharacterized protein n=1 Tax=uncultured Caudovirales phage TaxID=2100421 RepID=A0A6J5MBR3_9CAUD|nr:hypothetical protein UFOVP449_232 [uncultured Caudovirales phage]